MVLGRRETEQSTKLREEFKITLNTEFKKYLKIMDKKNEWDSFVLRDTVMIHFGLWLARKYGKPEKFRVGDKI